MKLQRRKTKEHLKWLLCVSAMVFLSSSLAQAASIRVQGMNANYKISTKKGELRLKGPGLDGFSVKRNTKGWAILDRGNAIRLQADQPDPATLVLRDSKGIVKFSIKFGETEYTVYGATEKDLFVRVVFDGESGFKVFDDEGEQSMVGIAKKRGVTVKDVTTSTNLFKIKGCANLREASYFAIPIQFTGNVLIWRALHSE